MRLFIRLLNVGACVVFAGASLAQFRGGIEGSVLDTSGSVVPGADVALRQPSTQREQRTVSSPGGFYRFSELAPGTYSIVAKKAGFADLTLNDIDVSGESVRGIDLHLQAAAVVSTLTVSAES